MRYQTRPIGNWTDPVTEYRSPASRFKAKWSDTLDLLGYETGRLGAELVVLQIDIAQAQIRQDGMPWATARVGFPGARVSFTSRFGPLTYATDEYDHWQANIRALALALEALRAVDRYGVTRRGEQYRGWLAIEAAPPPDRAAAVALLDSYGGERAALRATHPDAVAPADYDPEAFRAVQAARELLRGGGP